MLKSPAAIGIKERIILVGEYRNAGYKYFQEEVDEKNIFRLE